MMFANRLEAAAALIPFLEKFRNKNVVVLAIPRGGVPMGKLISRHFNWPLDLLLTKKIGHPMNKEYAIGAVGMDCMVMNEGHDDVPEFYIHDEVGRIRKSLLEKYNKFAGSVKPVPLKGKILILIDDGIATGYTMKASIEMLRKQQPEKIVIAVPVASPRTLQSLSQLADELIVLETPHDFMGVGQFYMDFSEVSDEDVIEVLNSP
jgi:putative phosphoribosyl transferase